MEALDNPFLLKPEDNGVTPQFDLDSITLQQLHLPHDFDLTIDTHTDDLNSLERKRGPGRKTFSAQQTQELEKVFQLNQYLTGSELENVCSRLQTSPKKVKVWFQNRRVREKAQKNAPGGATVQVPNSNGIAQPSHQGLFSTLPHLNSAAKATDNSQIQRPAQNSDDLGFGISALLQKNESQIQIPAPVIQIPNPGSQIPNPGSQMQVPLHTGQLHLNGPRSQIQIPNHIQKPTPIHQIQIQKPSSHLQIQAASQIHIPISRSQIQLAIDKNNHKLHIPVPGSNGQVQIQSQIQIPNQLRLPVHKQITPIQIPGQKEPVTFDLSKASQIFVQPNQIKDEMISPLHNLLLEQFEAISDIPEKSKSVTSSSNSLSTSIGTSSVALSSILSGTLSGTSSVTSSRTSLVTSSATSNHVPERPTQVIELPKRTSLVTSSATSNHVPERPTQVIVLPKRQHNPFDDIKHESHVPTSLVTSSATSNHVPERPTQVIVLPKRQHNPFDDIKHESHVPKTPKHVIDLFDRKAVTLHHPDAQKQGIVHKKLMPVTLHIPETQNKILLPQKFDLFDRKRLLKEHLSFKSYQREHKPHQVEQKLLPYQKEHKLVLKNHKPILKNCKQPTSKASIQIKPESVDAKDDKLDLRTKIELPDFSDTDAFFSKIKTLRDLGDAKLAKADIAVEKPVTIRNVPRPMMTCVVQKTPKVSKFHPYLSYSAEMYAQVHHSKPNS